jgi:gluconolactonase
MRFHSLCKAALAVVVLATNSAHSQDIAPPLPDALVDLSSSGTAALVDARWSWRPASIVTTSFPSLGVDGKASGPAALTNDVRPRVGTTEFLEPEGWLVLAPDELERRRGDGLLSFGWYRLQCRIPERIGEFTTAGATAVLELVVDDYAEVWVDGELPVALGRRGGVVVSGWNAPNRLVLRRSVVPGEALDVAIFAANAPLSAPPRNFVWVRSATLDLYAPGRYMTAEPATITVERKSPLLDSIVGPGARLERIATGFQFTEGPVTLADGSLLFSDPNANSIYRYADGEGVTVFRAKSGYRGLDIARYRQPGSNGLALDAQGRLLVCEHGNRRVTRLEANGAVTVLADRHEGKRLNSPNDVTVRSDGRVYFTDPPFGLPGLHDDPARELPHYGVYSLGPDGLRLEDTSLRGPNGIVFAPDERHLYVANWDTERKVVMRHAVASDGRLAPGEVFASLDAAPEAEALDGLEVDAQGNLFVSGPGGVWIFSATGEHLGTLRCPELPANFAWERGGKALYLTARSSVYRLELRGSLP